jgi:hypothetical protein
MKVYLIVRAALEENGNHVNTTLMKAFQDKAKAVEFMSKTPAVWNEKIDGVNYVCEIAIHEVELEQ